MGKSDEANFDTHGRASKEKFYMTSIVHTADDYDTRRYF